MPEVVVPIAASADDNRVRREAPTWAGVSGSANSYNATVTQTGPSVSHDGVRYIIQYGLLRWNTGAQLPDNAIIDSCDLELFREGAGVGNFREDGTGRQFIADWVPGGWDGSSASDWVSSMSADAHAGTNLSTLTAVSSWHVFPLDNVSNISTTGTTYMRTGITGGQPSTSTFNDVNYAQYDSLATPLNTFGARLRINYRLPPQRVGSSQVTQNAGSQSVVINRPTRSGAALQTDDVLIMRVTKGGFHATTVDDPAWTKFLELTDAGNLVSGNSRYEWYWLRVDGTEPATWTVSSAAGTTPVFNVRIDVFENCLTSGSPVEGGSINDTGAFSNGATITPPSLVTTGEHRHVLSGIMTRHTTLDTLADLTWGGSFTEFAEVTHQTAGTNSTTNGAAERYIPGSGVTASPSAVAANAQPFGVAATVALIPELAVNPPAIPTGLAIVGQGTSSD